MVVMGLRYWDEGYDPVEDEARRDRMLDDVRPYRPDPPEYEDRPWRKPDGARVIEPAPEPFEDESVAA